jgi:hypothetical protein
MLLCSNHVRIREIASVFYKSLTPPKSSTYPSFVLRTISNYLHGQLLASLPASEYTEVLSGQTDSRTCTEIGIAASCERRAIDPQTLTAMQTQTASAIGGTAT